MRALPIIHTLALLMLAFSAQASDERRFVFSYPFAEGDAMAPRGGTTQGPDVTLDPAPHAGWQALREPDLSEFERDRRAILAMAGPYRTSFDFLEIAGFTPGFEPDRPYQSWGTEYVYVLEDEGDFISLQHVLVMRIEGEDGEIEGPFVTKHWRQDWRYEDDSLLEYRGDRTWESVSVPRRARRGTWSQAVYQVDDSPRYESYGTWRHEESYSTWKSAETWRPLPRREYSVRDDYQVLVGTNEHTITPDGWVHRETNAKTVLDDAGHAVKQLALEYGVNRYQLIVDFDFSAGDAYLERTGAFWAAVRDAWDEVISEHPRFSLRGEVDGEKLYERLFEFADTVAARDDPAEGRRFAQQTIEDFLVTASP